MAELLGQLKPFVTGMQPLGSAEILPLTKCWPLLREGPLPQSLIDVDYLEKVFFHAIPLHFACPTSAVRKALKLFIKRTARGAYPQLPGQSELLERDRALVKAICDEPRARERLRELEISVEFSYSRFGRQRRGFRDKVLGLSLSRLLWLGYVEDPDCRPLADWTMKGGVKRPDIGTGVYLTSQVIETALSTDDLPPFPVESIEFARVLLLFGGLLSAAEALELFTTAVRLGCAPLELVLQPKPEHASIPTVTNVIGPAPTEIATLD